jgi:hypothetical protein
MAASPPLEAITKLEKEKNIWFSSVRPDGRPHLAPVWFVWYANKIYIGTDPKSVKFRNIHNNRQVALALEDGSHPLICEGTAQLASLPLADGLKAAFLQKYDWDITQEPQYNRVIEVTPEKWLNW